MSENHVTWRLDVSYKGNKPHIRLSNTYFFMTIKRKLMAIFFLLNSGDQNFGTGYPFEIFRRQVAAGKKINFMCWSTVDSNNIYFIGTEIYARISQ